MVNLSEDEGNFSEGEEQDLQAAFRKFKLPPLPPSMANHSDENFGNQGLEALLDEALEASGGGTEFGTGDSWAAELAAPAPGTDDLDVASIFNNDMLSPFQNPVPPGTDDIGTDDLDFASNFNNDMLSSHECPPCSCNSCCSPSPPAAVTVVDPQRRRPSRRSPPQPAVTVSEEWVDKDTKDFNKWRKDKNFTHDQLTSMRKVRRKSRNRKWQQKTRSKRRSGQGSN